jgi:hypothetical protein
VASGDVCAAWQHYGRRLVRAEESDSMTAAANRRGDFSHVASNGWHGGSCRDSCRDAARIRRARWLGGVVEMSATRCDRRCGQGDKRSSQR